MGSVFCSSKGLSGIHFTWVVRNLCVSIPLHLFLKSNSVLFFQGNFKYIQVEKAVCKRKLEDAEKCLPGGDKMPDGASLERSEKNGEESHLSPPANARHSDEKKRKLEEAEKN